MCCLPALTPALCLGCRVRVVLQALTPTLCLGFKVIVCLQTLTPALSQRERGYLRNLRFFASITDGHAFALPTLRLYAFDLACLHFDLTFSQLETESLACQSDSALPRGVGEYLDSIVLNRVLAPRGVEEEYLEL